MAVCIQGQADLRVAQQLHDHPRIHTSHQRERRGRVTQGMERHPRQSQLGQSRLEALGDGGPVEWLPGRAVDT